jgi:hypothetical protein
MDNQVNLIIDTTEGNDAAAGTFKTKGAILASPLGQLGTKVADRVGHVVYGGKPAVQSTLIAILIPILAALLESLSANCDTTPDSIVEGIQTRRFWLRRRYERQVALWVMQSQGIDIYHEVGGRKIGPMVLNVLAEKENEALLREAITTPPPIWRILS